MHKYLAVWSFRLPDGRRQEVTMTFWAHDDISARGAAHRWFNHAEPTLAPADFTLTNLSQERAA
jgi:hypothetical protein